jgi:hypothetical protein
MRCAADGRTRPLFLVIHSLSVIRSDTQESGRTPEQTDHLCSRKVVESARSGLWDTTPSMSPSGMFLLLWIDTRLLVCGPLVSIRPRKFSHFKYTGRNKVARPVSPW